MKQFDTVKNNEWVPTEEDLEGAIKVVDSLPTASASELGTTYLLNGTMEGYTKTHFYKCVQETVEGVTMYVWSDLNVGRYSVGNCSDIQLMMFDDGSTYRVLVAWKDPDDITVGSEKIRWKETRLVHQVGHMPVDVNDATDTFVSNQRDAYSTLGLYQTTITADSRKHYFKLFPVSEDGAITNDDINGRVAGYNYALTTKDFPWTRTGTGTTADPYVYTYLTFYRRSIDSTSGNYVYTEISYNDTTYFDAVAAVEGDPLHYNFKSGMFYYEYQNCFITWKGIQELIQNGEAENYFAIGSVITLPYHGDFGEMVYEVVDYDNVITAEDKTHTMTLESKYLYRWWDYKGGVVFDTNERAGVYTADTSQNTNKVYFSGQNTSTSVQPTLVGTYPTQVTDWPKTLSAEVYKWEKRYALYAESVHDSSDFQSVSAYHGDYNTVYNASWSGSYYECELPYLNLRRGDKQVVRLSSRTGTATASALVYPLRSPSDLKIDLNSSSGQTRDASLWDVDYKVIAAGGTLKYGHSYAKKDGTASTYKIVEPGAFIPGTTIAANTYYDTSSRETHDLVMARTEITRQAGAATSAQHEIQADSGRNANVAWGGFHDNFRVPFQPTLKPRNNGYADMFMRVPYMSGYKYRSHDSSVKYFIPVEPSYQMARSGNNAGTQTYIAYRSARLRDATEDIVRAVNEADRCAGLAINSYIHGREFTPAYFHIGEDTTKGLDLNKIMRELVPCPAQDIRFIKGKKYFKLRYVDITTVTNGMIDESSTNPSAIITTWPNFGWYYTKSTVSYLNVSFDVYSRCRGNTGALTADKRLSSDGTTLQSGKIYMGFFDELEEGVDYNDYQPIPTRAPAPLYVTKKAFSAVSSPSGDPSAQGWYTLSAKTGLYVLTSDTSVVSGTTYYTETYGYTEGTTTSASAYWWSCDGGVTECTDDFRGGATRDSEAESGYGYSGYDYENYRVTDIYQATIGTYKGLDDVTYEECSLYWKMPNIERTAYGNHVWAQSNLRMYFNGPMDTTTEYVHTKDGRFVKDTVYYYQKSGEGYVPLTFVASSAESATGIVADTAVSTWESKYGVQVYNRFVGGNPVGYKLDINSPDKHNDFGLSPVMQYQYNNTTSKWEPVYASGCCWWTDVLYYNGESGDPEHGTGGCPSINNGLRYDRLASMYWSGCILKGKDGDTYKDRFYISPLVARPGANGSDGTETGVSTVLGEFSTDSMLVDNSTVLSASTTYAYDADLSYSNQTTTTTCAVNFGHVQPRQSFLHGFLDCRYKRSSDTSYVSGKTYYLKNQYGKYIALSKDNTAVNTPYKHCLYELNGDYLSDLQDAKEFLDCIVPVVNRNGCYGTAGAYDFYNQSGPNVGTAVAANGGGLGGTCCIDKVWLMSTTQVNGGNGQNNYVWENPQKSANYGPLKKWGSYTNSTELNAARVKKGVSLGAHGTGGYADIMAGAQYWWLRSAGGTHKYSPMKWQLMTKSCQTHQVLEDGTWEINGSWEASEPCILNLNCTRLSPLITLG